MINPEAALADDLAAIARRIRSHVVTMSWRAKAPHVASALSCVDILVALYFRVAKLYREEPSHPDRDRIILSKGHACAALYACLAEFGYMPTEQLESFAQPGSILGLHPSFTPEIGIEATTGSLGHGLGIGCGIALAAKVDEKPNRVFVVLSDGECNEGSVWEAAMWAPAQGLSNVVAIVDFNKLQAIGRSTEIMSLAPLTEKWSAFGWDSVEIDGHDFGQLLDAFDSRHPSKPRAVIAHTVKGKGVSFMENDIEWHYRPPSDTDLSRALNELRGKP